MDFLDSITKVTNLVTLIAFSVAVIGALVATYLNREVRLISKAPPEQRAALIAKFLDRHGVDSRNLTKEQKYNLLRKTIKQRKLPWLILFLGSLLLAVILLAVIISQALRGESAVSSTSQIAPASKDETLILVALFDGPEKDKYRFTDVIISNLEASLSDPAIRVEGLPITINPRSGGRSAARVEGEKYRASFVIWGWYSVTPAAVSLSVNFEPIKSPYTLFTICASADGGVKTATTEDLYNFKMQIKASKELIDLSLIMSSMASYVAGDCPRAVNFLDQFLSRGHTLGRDINSAAYFMRGDCYLASDRPFLSTADFAKSIENQPSYQAYTRLGDFYSGLPKDKKALDYYGAAIQLAPPPKKVEILIKLGIAHERLGNMISALQAYRRAININDNVAFGEGVNKYLYYISDGRVEDIEKSKTSAKAITDKLLMTLRNRIALSLEHPLARFARAQLASDPNFAAGEIRYLRNQFPSAASLHYELANALLIAEKTRAAIAEYNRAIAIQPSHACAYSKRGGAYYLLGANKLALDSYNKALSIDPTLEHSLFGRGGIYFFNGEEELAADDFSKVIDQRGLHWRSGDAHAMRGSIYLRQGKFLAAYRDINKALGINPSHPIAVRYMKYLRKLSRDTAIFILLMASVMFALVKLWRVRSVKPE